MTELPNSKAELNALRAEVKALRLFVEASELSAQCATPDTDDPGALKAIARALNHANAVISHLQEEVSALNDELQRAGEGGASARQAPLDANAKLRVEREAELRKNLLEGNQRLADRVAAANQLRLNYKETVDRLREQLKKARDVKSTVPQWVSTDKLNETSGWFCGEAPQSPFVLRRRDRLKVLYLNSMGGSASRLMKGLMLHQGIESDCYIFAYTPRRHLVYPLETNMYGVLSQQELREFMSWAVSHYDIIQSTTMPMAAGVADCYDWLSEKIGSRHVWRETGFIHHYLHREDVLPLSHYQGELRTKQMPGRHRWPGKTFEFTDTHVLTDPHTLFYSSPEKGAYFQGKDIHWLPSIREPENFYRREERDRDGRIRVYVPYHRNAIWKGLAGILTKLEELKTAGVPLDVITSENAGAFFPDLVPFTGGVGAPAAYPIPNNRIPDLLSRVDIVIDQVLMGCYGNTGIEAMFAGVPVLGQRRYAEVRDAPIWDITEAGFKEEFMTFIESPARWRQLGDQGREYAMRVHTPTAVSSIAADQYRRIMDRMGA